MPLTTDNSMDYWGNEQPKCPHCDDEIDLGRYDLNWLYEEGEHTIDCPCCEKALTVSTRVSFSFNTDKQEQRP